MKREFLINIFFLILVNLLIKPFYILFIEARVQDTLGPNVYGLYFGIFNIAFILQIISDLGVQNFNSRTIAQNPKRLKEFLPGILGLKLILSIIYLAVGLVFAAIFGYLATSMEIFLMVSLNLIILSMILYLRTNIAAKGHYRLDSFISVLDKILLIGILSYFLFLAGNKESFSIYTFIYSQTASLGFVALLVLAINFKLAKIIQVKFDLKFSRQIIKKSLPFSLVIILMSLYMRMDGFMLEQLLNDESYQAGLYAASFRIYDAFNMIGYLFAVLLLPMFASLLKKRDELFNLIRSSHNLMLVISTLVIAGVFSFRHEIMEFLYPKHVNEQYGQLLGILMFSYFAISISYIYSTLLTSGNKLRKMNVLLFIGVAINLILNLIVIPKYGAKGAAYATIATQYFILIGQYYLCIKAWNIQINPKLLIKRVSFVVLILVLSFGFQYVESGLSWMINLLIFEIVLLVISLFFGLVDLRELRKSDKSIF